MTFKKRVFDVICALALLVLLLPLILWVAILIRVRDGGPVIYKSERMKSPDQAFLLWKFRTMTQDQNDSGVSGGDKTARITKTGAMLRRTRLDELPQLWNILRGDIRFVGPRPPLRDYVERFPNLYGKVLKSRPGITGLATLAFHKREESLLAKCKTAAETDHVYSTKCVPAKARLDLMYQQTNSLCYDFKLMLATVFKRLDLH